MNIRHFISPVVVMFLVMFIGDLNAMENLQENPMILPVAMPVVFYLGIRAVGYPEVVKSGLETVLYAGIANHSAIDTVVYGAGNVALRYVWDQYVEDNKKTAISGSLQNKTFEREDSCMKLIAKEAVIVGLPIFCIDGVKALYNFVKGS